MRAVRQRAGRCDVNDKPLYFIYGCLYVHDAAEPAPGSQLTEAHLAQGFARRPTAASIITAIA